MSNTHNSPAGYSTQQTVQLTAPENMTAFRRNTCFPNANTFYHHGPTAMAGYPRNPIYFNNGLNYRHDFQMNSAMWMSRNHYQYSKTPLSPLPSPSRYPMPLPPHYPYMNHYGRNPGTAGTGQIYQASRMPRYVPNIFYHQLDVQNVRERSPVMLPTQSQATGKESTTRVRQNPIESSQNPHCFILKPPANNSSESQLSNNSNAQPHSGHISTNRSSFGMRLPLVMPYHGSLQSQKVLDRASCTSSNILLSSDILETENERRHDSPVSIPVVSDFQSASESSSSESTYHRKIKKDVSAPGIPGSRMPATCALGTSASSPSVPRTSPPGTSFTRTPARRRYIVETSYVETPPLTSASETIDTESSASGTSHSPHLLSILRRKPDVSEGPSINSSYVTTIQQINRSPKRIFSEHRSSQRKVSGSNDCLVKRNDSASDALNNQNNNNHKNQEPRSNSQCPLAVRPNTPMDNVANIMDEENCIKSSQMPHVFPQDKNHDIISPIDELDNNHENTLRLKIVHCESLEPLVERSNQFPHTKLDPDDFLSSHFYSCTDCESRFETEFTLLAHLTDKHASDKTITCAHCYSQVKKVSIFHHLSLDHRHYQHGFVCGGFLGGWQCSFTENSKEEMLKHMTLNHGADSNFKCFRCSFSSSSPSDYITHIEEGIHTLKSTTEVDDCKNILHSCQDGLLYLHSYDRDQVVPVQETSPISGLGSPARTQEAPVTILHKKCESPTINSVSSTAITALRHSSTSTVSKSFNSKYTRGLSTNSHQSSSVYLDMRPSIKAVYSEPSSQTLDKDQEFGGRVPPKAGHCSPVPRSIFASKKSCHIKVVPPDSPEVLTITEGPLIFNEALTDSSDIEEFQPSPIIIISDDSDSFVDAPLVKRNQSCNQRISEKNVVKNENVYNEKKDQHSCATHGNDEIDLRLAGSYDENAGLKHVSVSVDDETNSADLKQENSCSSPILPDELDERYLQFLIDNGFVNVKNTNIREEETVKQESFPGQVTGGHSHSPQSNKTAKTNHSNRNASNVSLEGFDKTSEGLSRTERVPLLSIPTNHSSSSRSLNLEKEAERNFSSGGIECFYCSVHKKNIEVMRGHFRSTHNDEEKLLWIDPMTGYTFTEHGEKVDYPVDMFASDPQPKRKRSKNTRQPQKKTKRTSCRPRSNSRSRKRAASRKKCRNIPLPRLSNETSNIVKPNIDEKRELLKQELSHKDEEKNGASVCSLEERPQEYTYSSTNSHCEASRPNPWDILFQPLLNRVEDSFVTLLKEKGEGRGTRTQHHSETEVALIRYACVECSYTGNSRFHFSLHLGEHSKFKDRLDVPGSDKSALRCDVCGYYATDQTDFYTHHHLHGSQKDFICLHCTEEFDHRHDIISHMSDAHGQTESEFLDRCAVFKEMLATPQFMARLDPRICLTPLNDADLNQRECNMSDMMSL